MTYLDESLNNSSKNCNPFWTVVPCPSSVGISSRCANVFRLLPIRNIGQKWKAFDICHKRPSKTAYIITNMLVQSQNCIKIILKSEE